MTSKSIVAGIVDRYGHFNRMVITHPALLHLHVSKGERSYVLPNTKVQEPVTEGQAYSLIAILEAYVKKQQARLTL
jgi:hypothetical protein